MVSTPVSDYVPVSLITVDPYIDSGLVISTAYSYSNHSILVTTYQSNHGKHHLDDYFPRCALLITLPSSSTKASPTQLVQVSRVPLSTELIVSLYNLMY